MYTALRIIPIVKSVNKLIFFKTVIVYAEREIGASKSYSAL